jgi:hypothetical protein
MHEDDVARLSGQFDDPDGDAGNSGALLHQPYGAVAGGTGRVGLPDGPEPGVGPEDGVAQRG